jgi:toxin ParE1/3/4
MKVIIRERADSDLDRIYAWIEKDNPRAAVEVIRRIRERVGRLASATLAHMGRPGLDEGTRELVIGPYIVVYEVREERDEVIVLAIFHGAQDRERS